MTYQTILVSLNDRKRASAVLATALQIAAKCDAHLIGLYVIPPLQIYPGVMAYIPEQVIESQRQYQRDEADKVRQLFEKAVAKEDIVAEWRAPETSFSTIANTVVEHARCADLVVVSQSGSAADGMERAGIAEHVMLESGRPVLIVPEAGTFKQTGEYVLVAWNGGREAARAVFDALPMLRMAKQVKVLWIDPKEGNDHNIAVAGSELATALARHGVNVEAAHSSTNGTDVGNELLSWAADYGSDLLVMGGYGHSRFREFVLGGATRRIMQSMTVPVLMSH